jgi:DNA-binding HxlR family transcriptional regulator
VHDAQHSGCPIDLAIETLGIRWSLIVTRDLTFGNRRPSACRNLHPEAPPKVPVFSRRQSAYEVAIAKPLV